MFKFFKISFFFHLGDHSKTIIIVYNVNRNSCHIVDNDIILITLPTEISICLTFHEISQVHVTFITE